MNAAIAIDKSGSTYGFVLQNTIKSANRIIKRLSNPKLLEWDNKCVQVKNYINTIDGSTTNPETIIPFIKDVDFLFFYTDGMIYDIEKFKVI